jgi:formyltetrahydrofolate deformylase
MARETKERALAGKAPSAKASGNAEVRRVSGVRKIDTSALLAAQRPSLERTALEQTNVRLAAVEPSSAPSAGAQRIQLILERSSARLLLSCDAEAAQLPVLHAAICGSGASVLQADQHNDAESGRTFQRLSLALGTTPGGRSQLERWLGQIARRSGLSFSVVQREQRRRVAVFVSKYDHCLYDLLLRQRQGELDCEIPLIVSNHPDLEPLARQFDIDYECIGKADGPHAGDKRAVEAEQCALLEERQIELVVLARYMQILSDDFIGRFPGRVINIHHSFLPAFIGAKPYHQAQRRGVKLIGATAHYATAELDEGPIIEQDVARCGHKDSLEDLLRKGRDLERQVLGRAVRWHLEDRVFISGHRTVVFE